uniref:NMDA receptor synaptonuclear signaling and neuronal migration factor a n=1 Tax=Amphiprion ocellaris TaxID=80972 RepID=A0AAQ5Z2C7_AMPOC
MSLCVSCVCPHRAARAFGEYLSHTHPENRNGSGQRLCHPAICSSLYCVLHIPLSSALKACSSLSYLALFPAHPFLLLSFTFRSFLCPPLFLLRFDFATHRNFRKHLRMVGSRRIKAQTFAERRSKSFSRSWSDPTPVKTDSPHDPKDSGDLQTSCGTLDEGGLDDNIDWEEEREMERLACEGDDFVPPKIMLISSKVPKAEYVPTIIRRDDPSIIPILYDHEHATFDDILEEIEKKLTAYRRGSKFWRMLIFCQGGPGHLYLLKNKVATFAKVEKEEDMSQFWKRLSRFMSKVNPEPNLIHIMGCYVLGNPNGEKLFQKLKNLMRPYSVEFESPLELSAQGKEMIEMYFDFRLYRLWKTRQHSKLLDYEDFL